MTEGSSSGKSTDPAEEASIRSWPFPRSSAEKKAISNSVGELSRCDKGSQRNDLNKSLDAAMSARKSVLSLAKGFEDGKIEAPVEVSTPTRPSVATIVSSLDSKKNKSKNGPVTRSVLENSPWKDKGIGSVRSRSVTPGRLTHKVVSATPSPSRPNQLNSPSRLKSSFSASSVSSSVQASPGVVTPQRNMKQFDWSAPKTITMGHPSVSPLGNASTTRSFNDAPHCTSYSTPKKSPRFELTENKILPKITRKGKDSSGTSVGSGITNRILAFESSSRLDKSISDSTVSSYHSKEEDKDAVVISGGAANAEAHLAENSGKDFDQLSPGRAAKDPTAVSPDKHVDEPLFLESKVPEEAVPYQDPLLPKCGPSKDAGEEKKEEGDDTSQDDELHDLHDRDAQTYARVPSVALLPRAVLEFDLPTTPNRADNSMDISSLQASPIVAADESFVTLEDSWRPSALQCQTLLRKNEPVSAFEAPVLFAPPKSPLPETTDHMLSKASLRGSLFDECAYKMTSPTPQADATVDEFLAKDTPKTNNQSFVSDDSISSKSNSGARGPPSLPRTLSASKPSANPGRSQPDEVEKEHNREGSPFEDQSDVAKILAALERVIPSEKHSSHIGFEGPQEAVYVPGASGSLEKAFAPFVKQAGNFLSHADNTGDSTSGAKFEVTDASLSQSETTALNSTSDFDDDEDVFDGLETEVDFESKPTKVPTESSRSKSSRLSEKITDALPVVKSTSTKGCLKPVVGMGPSKSKTQKKNSYGSLRVLATGKSSEPSMDTQRQPSFPNDYSSSDDSSCSSDSYTVQTLETAHTVETKDNGIAKAFFDFLTYGDDESIYTMESESLVASAVSRRKSAKLKKPSKKTKKAESFEPELGAGPSFAVVAFLDLMKLMNCAVADEDLIRSTEARLSKESDITEEGAELDDKELDYHDPEVEALVYDAAFFENMWSDIVSKQPKSSTWGFGLWEPSDDNTSAAASATEDLSPEEQKLFDAVFPSSSASKTVRRKATQVLSVCRAKFPSLYQRLVSQLDRKAKHKPASGRVSSPMGSLPSVQEERGDDDEEEDGVTSSFASQGISFTQAFLSPLQDPVSVFLSAPSSTFVSECSDERGIEPVEGSSPLNDLEGKHTTTVDLPASFSAQSFVLNDYAGNYLEGAVEQRLVINYESHDAEKECKESESHTEVHDDDKNDGSTYILHYIEDASDDCVIAEASRDERSNVEIEHHIQDGLILEMSDVNEEERSDPESERIKNMSNEWETFTPPRHRAASAPKMRSPRLQADYSLEIPAKRTSSFPSPKYDSSNAYDAVPSPDRALSAPKLRVDELDGYRTPAKTQVRVRDISTLKLEESSKASSTVIDLEKSKSVSSVSEAMERKPEHWEAFSASYFDAAKEEELLATVKRNNTKRTNASKLKPSKFDHARPESRSKRQQRASAPLLADFDPKVSKMIAKASVSVSPTSVAAPTKGRRVADLYPPTRLDFEEFNKKKSKGTNLFQRL